jgi:hypothetical protein
MLRSQTDYQDVHFWPWACLVDARALLDAVNAERTINLSPDCTLTKRLEASNRKKLCAYHFILTTGSLTKFLSKSAHLFPALKEAYDAAKHLTGEAESMRNMVEHADINLKAQEKGAPRGGFERKSRLLDQLPGDKPGVIDAVSLIVKQDGIWLGGRLHVEKIVEEVSAIHETSKTIPQWAPDPQHGKSHP